MERLPEVMNVRRVYSEVKNRKSQEVHSDENQFIEVRTFEGVPVGSVSVRGSMKSNLGDFNSAEISVSVTVPTYVEELDAAAEYAAGKVDAYLAPALQEFVEILQDKGLIKKK